MNPLVARLLSSSGESPSPESPPPDAPAATPAKPRAKPLDLGQTRPVRLLFVPNWDAGQWRPVLLAYLRTFQHDDPVTLVLRLEPPSPELAERAVREVTACLAELGIPEDRCPDLLLEASDIPAAVRGGLYTAAFAYLVDPASPSFRSEAVACGIMLVTAEQLPTLRGLVGQAMGQPARAAPAPGSNGKLWEDPNRFARKPSLELELGEPVVVHGYQEFVLDARDIRPLPVDPPLGRKRDLVQRYFNRPFMAGRSFLDVGANGGFFSFWAAQMGASQVTALDMDSSYIAMIEKVAVHTGLTQVRPVEAKVQDFEGQADLVLAFAMVHWLYSCTANYGSLDAVVGKLARLTRDLLVVEWVAPDDRAIREFNHTQWNAGTASGPYTVDAFEDALRRHFGRIEILGQTSPTRTVYAALRGDNEVTITDELPLLAPRERVIASRMLAVHQGQRYFSRVYQGREPGTIEKQATGALAVHEEQMLRRLSGPYFPRSCGSSQADGHSTLTMERIEGPLLVARGAEVAADPPSLARFFAACLDLLTALAAAGVRHRDIRPANIIVRDGAPVLIDFGWAQTDDQPGLTPSGLGAGSRPPDGSFSDVYSMGRVFGTLVPRGSTLFAPLIAAMTALPATRDIGALRAQLAAIATSLPPAWDVPVCFPISRW